MNLTDLIQWLLTNGCKSITIGPTPEGKLFVQADQGIATGTEGNNTLIRHQKANLPLVDCLEGIKRDVLYCAELQPRIIPIKRN